MTTREKLESTLASVQKEVGKQTKATRKRLLAARAKAADAALNWVMAHQDRVDAFRSSLKGTRVSGVVDKLLDLLRGAAGRKAAPKKSAKKKPAKRAARKRAK